MKFGSALRVAALAAIATLTTFLGAAPANAAAAVPLTCGMVIKKDTAVYLAKNLRCPSFGLKVAYNEDTEGSVPHVTVDLRGHTLEGPGSGYGITNFDYPSPTVLKVTNGIVKNWEVGVGGDYSTSISKLALVGNHYGFDCDETCVADLAAFDHNGTGTTYGDGPGERVTRSSFTSNGVGAEVSGIYYLKVDSSVFDRNTVGVQGDNARPVVTNTLFSRNTTAVLINDDDDSGACADLSRIKYVKNVTNLEGSAC